MPTMLVANIEAECPLQASLNNCVGNGVQLGNERGDWDDDEDDELF